MTTDRTTEGDKPAINANSHNTAMITTARTIFNLNERENPRIKNNSKPYKNPKCKPESAST
ncbi:hypothetical protein SDC9_110782 [bioreactor metagenome]|uniref:Uncharacterized protein n=1 Tax=bioreactor metagenome TaxID=1076179 RepID=A0A645BFQ1_9ZZZZ